MNIKPGLVALAAALALQGCAAFGIADRYGNRYGGFYDVGTQYSWQLATCDNELAADPVPVPERKRAMACCMWRHGVPIDDAGGCALPPRAG
jgi:hypothetical protein